MNKPDGKQDVKTYYSYELDDNKKMIKYINWGAWLFSLIALVSFIFVITSLGTTIPMIIALSSFLVFGGLAFYVWTEYKKMKSIFDSEPVVAHSWGLETETEGLKSNIKWEDMENLSSSTIKFCILWNLTKYTLKYKSGVFFFYDNLENVKFLENFIRKNMKAVIDSQNEIKWTK